MKLIERTGHRYGRLVVLGKSPAPRMWRCRCDCGVGVLVSGSNLANGATRSCGCLASEWARQMGANPAFVADRAKKAIKHGCKCRGNTSDEYKTWLAMKSRCYRPSDKSYSNWGGRGISVCARWKNDFEAFFRDMGQKPTPAHTLDRLDPNGNYEPSNCRWATLYEQGSENRRGMVPVVVGGLEFRSLAAACRHFGVGQSTLHERLKAGIPIDRAFDAQRLKPRRARESYWRKSARPAGSSQ